MRELAVLAIAVIGLAHAITDHYRLKAARRKALHRLGVRTLADSD